MTWRRLPLVREIVRRNYDVMVRYVPAARLIRRADPDRRWTVLDVGSGLSGIAPFLPGWRTAGVDRALPDEIERGAPFSVASATALPFPDRSWDVVTCIDVLEHLPPEDRSASIREAFRVARRMVVIAFPSGATAREADAAMRDAYAGAGQEPPGWLTEHLRHPHPDADALAAEARAAGSRAVRVDVFHNESLALQRVHRFLARTTPYGYKAFSLACSLAVSVLSRPLPHGDGYRCFIVATFAQAHRSG